MKKKLFIISLLVSLFLFGGVALASGPLGKARNELDRAITPTQLENNLGESVGIVVKGILALVGTIFLVLTIYAGVLWMTAQGNSEQVNKAKGIIQTAVIGLFVVMAAYAITAFVTDRVSDTGSSVNTTLPN